MQKWHPWGKRRGDNWIIGEIKFFNRSEHFTSSIYKNRREDRKCLQMQKTEFDGWRWAHPIYMHPLNLFEDDCLPLGFSRGFNSREEVYIIEHHFQRLNEKLSIITDLHWVLIWEYDHFFKIKGIIRALWFFSCNTRLPLYRHGHICSQNSTKVGFWTREIYGGKMGRINWSIFLDKLGQHPFIDHASHLIYSEAHHCIPNKTQIYALLSAFYHQSVQPSINSCLDYFNSNLIWFFSSPFSTAHRTEINE